MRNVLDATIYVKCTDGNVYLCSNALEVIRAASLIGCTLRLIDKPIPNMGESSVQDVLEIELENDNEKA